ncbi:MAG: 23S rRNA (uracil(1939)-C(5))-methyltransferase RlmD [Xanthomonadales bacterium]|uniref:23S rRNA (uracil(1939)-C(5))-methyltransferase RlmD n=1 Tax=Dokdonella sp. TaxID=2291710 RepID=UPI002BC4568A|nr:23S rRNA (uracil(1939)-C(5))-methyltransferase RlmD [Xanthomonadales bacterium]MBK7208775.1 23S rRNA (uracil(1939)-C(5))-methyltransferase RlmD [Xanthomonadales bacterium]HQW75523.1 23S rRNA (uracil(1939)-C(5))-methyltransferase RlmD [Dokdonella sp.]HQY53781.1 23S rRNA (uracil(1939)-C(5))-methyltransferase RlmD [Dokdonella sp.]
MQNPEVEIESLTHDGRGVARLDGKTVFVAGALPGERALIRYIKRHRNYDEARVEELLSRSVDRVEPRCPHFGVCGGCAFQHLPAGRQIEVKQNVLAENFERIGKVSPERWLPPLGDEEWGYRRKGRLSVKWVEQKNKAVVGFREDNPRFIADLSVCHTLLPEVGRRIDALSELIGSLEARREIAQIEIAAGDDTVALVFRHLLPLVEADREKLKAFGVQHDLAILLQPKGPDSVHPLWPETLDLYFRIVEADVDLAFKPLDFIQVNAGMNQRMIRRTLDLLDVQADDVVLDLFCGLGNFTLPIARHAAAVVGVEGDEGLVARAAANAERNDIDNARFHAADLLLNHASTAWARAGYGKMLLDPPRSGAAAVLDYLPRKGTDRIVYVSCHPGSLARDAGILVNRHGFRLAEAGVMDMFPHTAHVESIALFIR